MLRSIQLEIRGSGFEAPPYRALLAFERSGLAHPVEEVRALRLDASDQEKILALNANGTALARNEFPVALDHGRTR